MIDYIIVSVTTSKVALEMGSFEAIKNKKLLRMNKFYFRIVYDNSKKNQVKTDVKSGLVDSV